jgi:transglutaminase-like putative cysteine protease
MKQDATLPPSVVYGLLAGILLIGAPHAAHLPPWVSALSVVLLGWRAYLAHHQLPLPKRWLLLLITCGGMLGVLLAYHTLFGREAGITLLVLLAALKQLELRTRRDATLVIYLACFIIITNFFYSQSIPTALFMLATLLLLLATWLQLHTGPLAFKPRLRIAATLLAQAVPLMLVLFVLFPRVQGPLWGMPQDAYARSGLDDKMSPGSIGKLALSDEVAFRVVFHGKPPLRGQMYWRGPVLWDYDGQTWTPGRSARIRLPQFDATNTPVDYTVTLEPHNKTWLFALEMPTRISIPAQLTYDFQLRRQKPVNARLRYDVHSELGYRANAEENPFQLRRALQLPRGLDPRARQLAADWRTQNDGDSAAIVRTALRYFSQQGFQYTLEPPALPGSNGIDDFLFDTKQGFCEHYASAFVFLMRAAGIPARVVTGYQGGDYNALGGYYIVRQSDAHAWVEVWLSGRGWVRIDPTAAAAPTRIENGVAAAAADAAVLPLMVRNPPQWLRSLQLNWDALANQWNQWVLGYDAENQFALLKRLGMEDVSWRKMALEMLALVAVLVGLFSLLMLRRLRTRIADPALALYLKFCRKLEKAGVARAAHEGPHAFAARAAALMPQAAAAIAAITAHYVALRYGRGAPADGLSALRREIAAFKL